MECHNWALEIKDEHKNVLVVLLRAAQTSHLDHKDYRFTGSSPLLTNEFYTVKLKGCYSLAMVPVIMSTVLSVTGRRVTLCLRWYHKLNFPGTVGSIMITPMRLAVHFARAHPWCSTALRHRQHIAGKWKPCLTLFLAPLPTVQLSCFINTSTPNFPMLTLK